VSLTIEAKRGNQPPSCVGITLSSLYWLYRQATIFFTRLAHRLLSTFYVIFGIFQRCSKEEKKKFYCLFIIIIILID
jgi:hypothetical protein